MRFAAAASVAELAAAIGDEDGPVIAPVPDLAEALNRRVEVTVTTPAAIGGTTDAASARPAVESSAVRTAIPPSTVNRVCDLTRKRWQALGEKPEDAPRWVIEALTVDDRHDALLDIAEAPESVTIVAPELFDQLQRQALEGSGRSIPSTTDVPLAIDTIKRAPTRQAAIEAVIDACRDDPSSVGIVVDPAGPYWQHLQGLLEAHNIPHGPRPTGDGGITPFLTLLNCICSAGPTSVARSRPVLSALGFDPSVEEDHRPIGSVEDERARWISAITEHGGDIPIGTLLEQFTFRADDEFPQLKSIIEELDVAERHPTFSIGRAIELMSHRHRTSSDGEGVVLVDATAATVVDREQVFILGPVDAWVSDWNCRSSTGPQMHRMSHLFTSGEDLCILDTEADRPQSRIRAAIGDPAVQHIDPPAVSDPPTPGFDPEGRPREGHDRLTKSTLNALVASPRDGMFASVLDRPATEPTARGIAVHEFAELLLADPAAIDSVGQERILEAIAARVTELVPAHRHGILETRLNAALAIVSAYLETVEIRPSAAEPYIDTTWFSNELATEVGASGTASVAEQYFIDETLGISGVIDLVVSPTHLVDFKSGSPAPVRTIIDRGRPGGGHARADFQLPMYLAALRRREGDEPLAMTFVFCNVAVGAGLAGHPDIEAVTRRISYCPRPVATDLTDATVIEELARSGPPDHPRRRAIEEIGADTIATIVDQRLTERHDLDETVAEAIEDRLQGPDRDSEALRAGCRSLARALTARRQARLYMDDLDDFEQFLADWHERRASYDADGYPLGDPTEGMLAFPELHHDLAPVLTDGDMS